MDETGKLIGVIGDEVCALCSNVELTEPNMAVSHCIGHRNGVCPRRGGSPQRRGIKLPRSKGWLEYTYAILLGFICLIHFLLFPLLTDTEISVVEEFFKKLTARDDIAIVLINQTVSTCTL
jgi:hypothetical protein